MNKTELLNTIYYLSSDLKRAAAQLDRLNEGKTNNSLYDEIKGYINTAENAMRVYSENE